MYARVRWDPEGQGRIKSLVVACGGLWTSGGRSVGGAAQVRDWRWGDWV